MKKIKYLVVDDEEMIRDLLTTYFKKYGIESDSAANAAEARKLLSSTHYDLATVDVVMPGESGIELTKWIKAEKGVPVILLTSLDEAVDMVAGLEIGADDYVGKPFDPRVLLARSKAVLRRNESNKLNVPSSINEGVLRISERVLNIGAAEYGLNATELKFLEVLLASKGEVVTREELFLKVFDKDWIPEDRSVDNLVARLRQKFEPSLHTPKYIITVRYKGYMVPQGMITQVE